MRRELIIVPNERQVVRLSRRFTPFRDHDAVPFGENSPEVRSSRIKVLLEILRESDMEVVSTLLSVSRYTISKKVLLGNVLKFKKGDVFGLSAEDIASLGYERVETVREIGEFAIRGYIVDIFPPTSEEPLRIELFDDEIEDIRVFDRNTQRSKGSVDSVVLTPVREYVSIDHSYDTIVGRANGVVAFEYFKDFKVKIWRLEDLVSETRKRISELLEIAGPRSEEYRKWSFVDPFEILESIDYELIDLDIPTGTVQILKVDRPENVPIIDVEDLNVGDLVVHKDYGIGIFEGLVTLDNPLGKRDFLKIRYSDSILYVPVEKMNRVHRYIGPEGVEIDSLRAPRWRKRVKKAKKDIERRVRELVKLYMERESVEGVPLGGDPELEEKFAKSFPYIETPDQLRAIEETLSDLASRKPMDRLICGDSGFGKTEVALRATFRTVVSGKQVAVLAPTVALANQHYRTFKERLEPFGVVVELLDGTRTKSQRERIIEGLKKGKIDVIVGTHSLLSKDVKFSDLGLVVIDEEHKFGVEQKEQLKKLRLNVNVLSMSATPIPRTLQMALSGMRDMSTINTPPLGRKPVVVHIMEYSDSVVRSAVMRELARGGQVIYVHNRVEELGDVLERLSKILPDVKIVVAHGRMGKRKLEKAIESFYSGEVDLILCTTVIESGLDIPTANTIIVDDAHRYGLSQLYQLRGRVGRRSQKGHAYFLYPKGISKKALERIKTVAKFSGPGSGMEIALKDLEMRGYGDPLGLDQSGYIGSIGYKYYIEIIKEAISKYRGQEGVSRIETEIENFPGSVHIPEDYVKNPLERLRFYRRLSSAESVEDIDKIADELSDRFGKLPSSVENLITLSKLKVLAEELQIDKVRFEGRDVILKFRGEIPEVEFENAILNEEKKVLVIYSADELVEILERMISKSTSLNS